MNKTHNQDDKMSEQFKTKNGFGRSLFQYALIGVLSMGVVSLPGCFSSGGGEEAVNVSESMSNIESYAYDNTRSAPTVRDYAEVGITGVNAENLPDVNAALSSKVSTGGDNKAQIQAYVNDINAIAPIKAYANNNANPVPTVQTYADAGVTGVNTQNLADVNAALDVKDATGADSRPEIQAIIDGVNEKLVDAGAASDTKMVLLTENLQLPSGDSGSVRITANLKDVNNNLMTGEPVSFTATSGSLQVLKNDKGLAATDNLGNVVAVLSSPNNPILRKITVTATGGGSASTLIIDVTGTKLEVSGPANAIAFGQSTELTVKLKAGDGSVLQNKEISVISKGGNDLSAAKITTNEQGEASVTVTDSAGVTEDSITFSALDGSVSWTFILKVSADSIQLKTSDDKTEIPLSTAYEKIIEVELREGGELVNKVVHFSITRGSLEHNTVTTIDGVASVKVKSNNAGDAIITASTDNEEATLAIEFVATVPTAINLEAAPKRVSLEQTSTLTATVRDADKNLVKNQKVLFNLSDITGGSLSKGEVFTNSLGQASSVYTAGRQASGEGAVVVTATLNSIQEEARLTVDPQNVRIIFGTGNKMFEPNSAQYRVPYVIQVSDDGGPVAGVDVDISAFPTHYYKGSYVRVNDKGRDIEGAAAAAAAVARAEAAKNGGDVAAAEAVAVAEARESFAPVRWKATQFLECEAEDINRNGILDPKEDTNENGILDLGEDTNLNDTLDPKEDTNEDKLVTPPAVFSIGPSPELTPTVSNSTVTTDANGFGYFSIYYPKNFAHWIRVELVAQTTQAGRQSTFSHFTRPVALAKDVNDINISPPAPNGSPFGTGTLCTDPN